MNLRQKTNCLTLCVAAIFALTAVYYAVFLLYPIIHESKRLGVGLWDGLLANSIYPPFWPRWIVLGIGGVILALGAGVVFYSSLRTRRIFFPLLEAMNFCEFLAAGKFPPPMRVGKFADRDIAALLTCLNTARDRMCSNMARLKASHEREIEARRFAENSGDLKSMLLARIAPDIRSPLSAINGYSELIRRKFTGLDQTPSVEKLLAGIERNVQVISEIIVRMLAVDKVGRNQNEDAGEVIQTTDFINEVVAELTPRLQARNVALEHVFSGSAPDRIYADRAAMSQLLGVMIQSLFRASNPGERISVQCRSDGGSVFFLVRDNRQAAARERLADLYNVGRRDSRRRMHIDNQSTTVLGLFFVESQAISMGGMLSAQSTKQALTELTLSFKKTDLATAGELDEKLSSPRQAENTVKGKRQEMPRRARKKYHILLGEEDSDSAEVIEKLLTLDNFKVVRADSVAELLDAAQKERFDAVLLSNAMRHRNMLATVQKIRKTSGNTGVPVLIMASKISAEKRKQLQMVGVSQVMLKPLDFKALSGVLQQRCLRYAGGGAND